MLALLLALEPAALLLPTPMSGRRAVGASSSPSRSSRVTALDRRQAVTSAAAAAAAATLGVSTAAIADGKPKVVVFGGSGYVGAYASRLLLGKGAQVVSVSRKTPAEQADKVKAILGAPLAGVEYVQLDASTGDLSGVLGGAAAVISCIGIAPGGANMRDGNGLVNVKIAAASKLAAVPKFVYLGLASELASSPIKFVFGDYVKGKAEAEAAVGKDYPSALVLKPGIIAGGPPGEVRPPGPPGMAPVAVEDVARAAVAGALGNAAGTVDGNTAIAAAAAK
ncbi:hypothetical protein EMIHUDRAFT_438510 [Emiliania huxleyi CCMP1516]|uniref:NmrA-like domain-containing protein n=2 Tax=Emiliania huxleyi TaxID=2903 RepID=A0A0D3I8Z1_EMIH1|nr:hypothetical protein EMIHUDRAFT_438510 [Emiliania huxleyi CCMP1516]EOD07726.1 hypothetical protein EMIHUDRAFT_438510 [Emiliania huxleyi CCMP1516]|eukprot:XP_005760155.1 hypothetical protein EMIHUDRAFT_438510 [Emiliania huxleyi CCMP1516]